MFKTRQRWAGFRFMASSAFVCLSLVLPLMLGCQGGSTEVPATVGGISGTVTFNDQPVTEGQVVFRNVELNTEVVGNLDAEGKYSATGVVVGKALVSVRPLPPPTTMDATQPPAPDPANIPKKYRDPKTSGLELEVTEGAMTFDIQMKS